VRSLNNRSKQKWSYLGICISAFLTCLNQGIFVLNEEYCLNEKKAGRIIDVFAVNQKSIFRI